MPTQVLINLFIAFLWMLMQESINILTFFTGYLVGLFILFLLRRYLKQQFYVVTFLAVINLTLIFLKELFISSIFVIKRVIKPRIDITPGIFALETDLYSDLEITLISMLITLTPGSVVMEIDVAPDLATDDDLPPTTLFIHGFDLPESIVEVTKSKNSFENAIKKVTRKR